jgi:hypothetical protein
VGHRATIAILPYDNLGQFTESKGDMEIKRRSGSAQNYQKPEKEHTFRTCGCVGILPTWKGSNKFAKFNGAGFQCRAAYLVTHSRIVATKLGYAPIPSNTPHSVIRKLMDEPNCERCRQPLMWELGNHKTPHLHHDHETGEIYGFTHPKCNPRALEDEIERLKKLLQERGA